MDFLDEELYARLKRVAQHDGGRSVASAARIAILQYVKSREYFIRREANLGRPRKDVTEKEGE
mgnify:CR=1 FL=1